MNHCFELYFYCLEILSARITFLIGCFFYFVHLYRNIKNAERAETAHKHNSTKYEYSLVFPPSAGGRALKALGIFVLTFGFFQMVKEVFQIIFKRLRYFADPTNYMEWSIYITAIVYMWKLISDERLAKNKFEFGIVSLFLGWINVLVFLKRVTFCKLFVIMFFNVCFTLTKVFLIFSVVFLAFILTFHQLFIKQNTFKTFGRTISKVIVMVSGEMDYEGFLTNSLGKRDSESNYRLVPFSTISYVVVVVFVLFMVIALMNLLVSCSIFFNYLILLP